MIQSRVHPAISDRHHPTLLPYPFTNANLIHKSLPSFHHTLTQNLIMVAQTAAFKKAVEESRKLKANPNNDELLEVPILPPVFYISAMKVAHADRSNKNSSTQTTSKVLVKTSPRPHSPAPSPSRFVHPPSYLLPSPYIHELFWLMGVFVLRRNISTMRGRKSLSKTRSLLLQPSSTTFSWWRS